MNNINITPNLNQAFNLNNDKSKTQNQGGASFVESMKGVAQPANIQVANGNNAATLNLNRHKEETMDELFSFTRSDEEELEDSWGRIKKMLLDLKQ